MRMRLPLLAVPLLVLSMARADAVDFAFSGYLDARVIAPAAETSWVQGGLGKFRFGPDRGNFRFVEAIGQAQASFDNDLSAVVVGRLEPTDSAGLDFLEAYALYAPRAAGDLSWSVKAGAFFPTISFENDDIGWQSPYTITPSAINAWIGEELRTIGAEGTLRWNAGDFGVISAMGSLLCCNDEAGILMADRGWGLHDRATGLLERIRIPDATIRIFRQRPPFYTGEFDEIEGDVGWYGGLTWQLPDSLGKISIVRYDNNADPAAVSRRDTGWDTRFWSFAGRTQFDNIILIAQHMAGYTSVVSRNTLMVTKFQSVFLLGAMDWNDWRFSMRGEIFQTRKRPSATTSPFSEDGAAFTAAVSWTGIENLRLAGEVILMGNRRLEYRNDGLPARLTTSQAQLSARYSLN
jgi:hypothetical protein